MSQVCLSLLFLIPSASLLFGQATSRLTGDVVDRTAAAVPEAQVTVLNVATGAERKATTSQLGDYTFPSLAPGDYTVSVSKSGFADSNGVVAGGEGRECVVAQLAGSRFPFGSGGNVQDSHLSLGHGGGSTIDDIAGQSGSGLSEQEGGGRDQEKQAETNLAHMHPGQL